MIHVPAEVIKTIWEALSAPVESWPRSTDWSAAKKSGWVHRYEMVDAIYGMDRRIEQHGIEVETLAMLAEVQMPFIYPRVSNVHDVVAGHQALRIADAAAVLILLERLGFRIDANALCKLVRPTLKAKEYLTVAEDEVLFFNESRHKTPPLELHAKGIRPDSWNAQTVLTESKYRAELVSLDDGTPYSLIVRAPNYRERPAPRSVSCDVCGMTYLKGAPNEERVHRNVHRQRMRVLDPQPSLRVSKTLGEAGGGLLWIDSKSPTWLWKQVYERAVIFRREQRYDFVQWSTEPSSNPDAIGCLFVSEDFRVLGACAFRFDDGAGRGWRMDWIWICPPARRQGHLTRHWPAFKSRFGEFEVTHPLSDAMLAFLNKHEPQRYPPSD